MHRSHPLSEPCPSRPWNPLSAAVQHTKQTKQLTLKYVEVTVAPDNRTAATERLSTSIGNNADARRLLFQVSIAESSSQGPEMKSSTVDIQGYCHPRFNRVLAAMLKNFSEYEEIGASVSVVAEGEVTVDLWAGWRDVARTKPWNTDTIVNFWSATKGINGACFAMLVDRGMVSYDDKVSRYWPEFAVAGKQSITVGMLLAHQGGLCAFLEPTTIEEMLAGEPAAARLAAQAPLWEPGATAGYHGMTLGVLSTALFIRIEGRSIKRFVEEEIAKPYGLELSIGVSAGDVGRVAEMQAVPALDVSAFDPAKTAQYQAFANPPTPGSLSNDPRWYAADLPSANGFGNARALAGLYALLLRPSGDGRVLVGRDAIAQAARCRFEGHDIVKDVFTRWSAGFWLNPDRYLYGPHAEAFGFSGWGGSFGLADPVADVAASYTMNRMSNQFDKDPRRRGLVDAIFASL
jgi:CubicO group peptidase (beta-lactamase class C family)